MLHDREVPRTRGNIDHLIVAPAGIFVVDAKNHRGLIEIRNRGSMFRPNPGLFVGRRAQSKLAEGLTWQLEAVMAAVEKADTTPLPRVPAVLCFVDGEWPLIRPPHEYAGVRLEGTGSIRKLLTASNDLDRDAIDNWTGVLATAFPAK